MRADLYRKEQEKYEFIHKKIPEYGVKSVRYNWFKNKELKFIQQFDQSFLESDTFLDVGCGKGKFIEFFSELYNKPIKNFIGLDISMEALSKCPSNIRTIHSSLTSIPLQDNSIDFVYHLDGMEHIPKEVEDLAITEMMRVSKKYVVFMIGMFPSIEDPIMKENNLEELHINIKNAIQWKETINSLIGEKFKFKHFEEYTKHCLVIIERVREG